MGVKKKNIQFSFDVPSGLSSIVREQIGAKVIEDIQKRTDKGLDKEGRAFPKYTKGYKESDDFQAAGKGSKVNLRLSSEMMDSLSLIENTDGRITVGYNKGDEVAGRVEGNVIGSYGDSTGHADKARDFLGVPAKRLRLIIREVIEDSTPIDIDTGSIAEGLVGTLLNRSIFGDNEDG